jgi:uncharacterized membrane protein (DUF4010 family)
MNFVTFETLGIALALGLLVGLQRQRAEKPLAGIRTFPLITLFGTICAMLAQHFTPLMVPLGLLAIVVLVAIENLRRPAQAEKNSGVTTEAAILVMFAVGAYLVHGERAVALAVTGSLVLLLYAKQPMHRFVRQMGEGDITAIVQFVIISLIILPLLPRRTYGPYAVLNPFEIWLMVVLIVALNLLGYIAWKLLSARSGTLISGVLGGLVSSTATTVSYSRQAAGGGVQTALAALVIMLASTVVFARILFEIGVVAAQRWADLSGPVIALLIINILISALAYLRIRSQPAQTPVLDNPAELKPALLFGLLYALVIFAVAAVKDLFGERALYVVAILSGLTDVDAITLSTAQLVNSDRITSATGWRLILCAALANLGFKLGIGAVLGGRVLFRRVLALFALTLLSGIVLLWLWP